MNETERYAGDFPRQLNTKPSQPGGQGTAAGLIDTGTNQPASIKVWPETLTDGSVVWNLWIGNHLVAYCISEQKALEARDIITLAILRATGGGK